MEPNETTLVSGRIVAEFEDDAAQFLAGAAEFVHAPPPSMTVPAAINSIPPANEGAQEGPA